MNFIWEQCILVIFGGNNDVMSEDNTVFMNDLCLLNLYTLEWMKVNMIGAPVAERAFHTSSVDKSQLIIFGGINSVGGFCGADLVIIEMDQRIT